MTIIPTMTSEYHFDRRTFQHVFKEVMNFDEASIPVLVLERIGITCVSDFLSLDESDIDDIKYYIIGEEGSSMGSPRKLPMGYGLRLQLFLRWARQLAVDRGAPLTLQDWWHVRKADFDDYRINSVRTQSPLPVHNPYKKAVGVQIPSTPIEITKSRPPSLDPLPATILLDPLPIPPSPTASIDNASFSSSSTVVTPIETSVFVNGKRFVLPDHDHKSYVCDMGNGSYGYQLTGEFVLSLESIYRSRGAMFRYNDSKAQVKHCTAHHQVTPH